MRILRFVLLGLTALAMTSLSLRAAATPKPGAGKALPSARLRQMIDNTLPRIASLTPKQRANREALATVHAEWTALAQTAPAAQQPTYAAAANVVQALLAAVDEHAKAVEDFRYSKSVHGAQDNKDVDISNGGQLGGTARANNAKQNKMNADDRKALLQKEEFMNKGVADQWKTRTAQIGTAVEQLYTTELVTEKQMVAARKTTPAPAPMPPTPKSTSAAEAYSPAGAWKVPKGNWTLSDDGTFTTAVGGKGTWQWGDRAKRELQLKWANGADTKGTLSDDGQTLEVAMPKGGQATLKR
ncbi:hypothetical protein CfE428DRAFT_2731 [Chthoniobacter flavus Ellin428]|uniref:Uncharacterized protein n=1 Tax=Chthoniobacter flavus Ellin428 TaxID=497964 RepID=B4D1E3_9BACT|nr:hypothetical protein [Chthoniobacter flavus]EDY19555.1 hypothetical protein CfE428DRAFT_2731 [Chthoniobacter flavus Ellin428]TCO92799.1 hypothetical protein EV701_10576 [Chthoniobacter flavus]